MSGSKKNNIKDGLSGENISPKEELIRRRAIRLKAKKKARRRRFTLLLVAVLLTSIILVTMNVLAVVNSFLDSINNDILIEGVEPLANQPVNILLLGMDSGDVSQTQNSDIKRTDTIMVLNYNPNTNKVNIVSIPRDTLVEIDAYDGTGALRNYWKINTAYVLGGEEEVVEHVEHILDTTINYIVKIDYVAFRNFIDAIGGVEMYIEQDMYYDDPYQDLSIHFNGGETVLLDGQSAEEFFRWRQNNDGTGFANGDLGRIENQQKFIREVINKCLTSEVLNNIPEILEVIAGDVSTNMPGKEIINYAFKGAFNDGISMLTLQGYDATFYGESFLVVEKENNMEIIEALKTGVVLDENTDRSDYKILVLNGTRVNGLAGELKEGLESIGYSNIQVNNTETIEKSLILSDNDNLRDQLVLDIGIKEFKNKDEEYSEYDAVVIVGEDLKIYE